MVAAANVTTLKLNFFHVFFLHCEKAVISEKIKINQNNTRPIKVIKENQFFLMWTFCSGEMFF